MAVLILGVGYLGSALAGYLLGVGQDVVGFDNLRSTDRKAIDGLIRHGAFDLVEGDLSDPEAVGRAFDAARPDTVFLLAAQSSPDDAAAPPEYTELTNLRGPRLVFDQCWLRGVETVIFGSSLRVYGQPLPASFDESTAYGAQRDLSHLSKIYAEKLLELYATRAREQPVAAVAARLAIVYGLAPVMKRDYAFMTVPNRFALQARRGDTLRLSAGAGALSLIHVEDAVRALVACAALPARGYQPVNVLGEWLPLRSLAQCVVDEGAKRGLEVTVEAPAESLVPIPLGRSLLDDEGFARQRDVPSGIRELLDYFLADRAV